MKYTRNDLENIIALCEQDDSGSEASKNLVRRCKNALAYNDISIRLTKRDIRYLRTLYDPGMDQDAMFTLNKIKGM